MCAGKKIILVLIIVVFSSSAVAKSVAWWLTTEYKPRDTCIEGIPVKKIDPNLSKVLVLNNQTCCQRDSNKLKDVENTEQVFLWTGDLNGDGREDKVLVGVYQDKSNQMGEFLLVLTRENGKWRKAVIYLTASGTSRFSILSPYVREDDKHIKWAFCSGCDTFFVLRWERNQYRLY